MIDTRRKKSVNLQTMVTRSERDRIKQLAGRWKRTVSETIRLLVLDAMSKAK